MEQISERKYSVGIQTISGIRKGNYIYIGKTHLACGMTKTKKVKL